MSNENEILKISSKYILKHIFSYLKYNYFLKLIKYNKNLQKQLDINLEDSIYNYKFCIKANKEILTSIEDMTEKLNIFKSYNYISTLSFSAKFCLKYSYYFPGNINEKKENFFLTKYKGFKINDYPLPFNFN